MKDTVILDKDVYWTMNWNQERFPEKPAQEQMFEESMALARLLAHEVIFLNSHWWEETWPEEARKQVALCVNCSDVFAWGCADAEGLLYDEIQDLYDHWIKDPSWGAAVWCVKKRKEMPQKPVFDAIQKAGIWNLEEMNLAPNPF